MVGQCTFDPVKVVMKKMYLTGTRVGVRRRLVWRVAQVN